MDVKNMQTEGNGTEKKTNFIPNPLPVPKRHTKREMGYDHEISPDKMHYDVEIHPGDDIDL